MRIAISATGPSLDSEIDARFGRSEHFIVVETESMEFETLRNPNLGASSGAGIGTAQLICDQGVGAVVTGNIGPKAHRVLSAAGVRMLTGVSGRIRDAIERLRSGKLLEAVDAGAVPGKRAGSATEPGTGRGGGRGMGMGRGMGRGMGCGGGKGMGMGRSRGGTVAGDALRDRDAEPWPEQTSEPSSQEDIALLKRQAKALTEELGKMQQRIEQMEKK
jgi:predicted Fe-Mo cluster-binding NifX family protein